MELEKQFKVQVKFDSKKTTIMSKEALLAVRHRSLHFAFEKFNIVIPFRFITSLPLASLQMDKILKLCTPTGYMVIEFEAFDDLTLAYRLMCNQLVPLRSFSKKQISEEQLQELNETVSGDHSYAKKIDISSIISEKRAIGPEGFVENVDGLIKQLVSSARQSNSERFNFVGSMRVNVRGAMEAWVVKLEGIPLASSSPIRESNRDAPNSPLPEVCGLTNVGNTCYMNSILQGIFANGIFLKDLYKFCKKVEAFELDLAEEMPMSAAICSLGINRQTTSDMEKQVLLEVTKNISGFKTSSEQDAHEFLANVLCRIQDECDEMLRKRFVVEDVAERRKQNPVTSNFAYVIQTVVTCERCQNVTKSEEESIILPVPINVMNQTDQRSMELQKLINECLKTEKVDKKCEKCEFERAKKSQKFTRIPRCLIIFVKRYVFNAFETLKRDDNIGIPLYLTLKWHCIDKVARFPPVSPTTLKIDIDKCEVLKRRLSADTEPSVEDSSITCSQSADQSEICNGDSVDKGKGMDSTEVEDSVHEDRCKLTARALEENPVSPKIIKGHLTEARQRMDAALHRQYSTRTCSTNYGPGTGIYTDDEDLCYMTEDEQIEEAYRRSLLDQGNLSKSCSSEKWHDEEIADAHAQYADEYISVDDEYPSPLETPPKDKEMTNETWTLVGKRTIDASQKKACNGSIDDRRQETECKTNIKAAVEEGKVPVEESESMQVEQDVDEKSEIPRDKEENGCLEEQMETDDTGKDAVQETVRTHSGMEDSKSVQGERDVEQFSNGEVLPKLTVQRKRRATVLEPAESASTSELVGPPRPKAPEPMLVDEHSDDLAVANLLLEFSSRVVPYRPLSEKKRDEICEELGILPDTNWMAENEVALMGLNAPPAEIVENSGAGNGVYRALAYYLTGSKEDWDVVRHTIICFEKEYGDILAGVKNYTSLQWQKHMQILDKNEASATKMELYAFASKFNVDVWVFQNKEWLCHMPLFRIVDGNCLVLPEDDHVPGQNESLYFHSGTWFCPVLRPSSVGFRKPSYRLISVVSHHGKTSDSGHYTCDVWCNKSQRWCFCDDKYVEKINEETVRSKENSGYIYFYLNKEFFEDDA